jgi:hypothetical protein
MNLETAPPFSMLTLFTELMDIGYIHKEDQEAAKSVFSHLTRLEMSRSHDLFVAGNGGTVFDFSALTYIDTKSEKILQHLDKMTRLRGLILGGNQKKEIVIKLTGLTNLVLLRAVGTEIPDWVVECLPSLTRLVRLYGPETTYNEFDIHETIEEQK